MNKSEAWPELCEFFRAFITFGKKTMPTWITTAKPMINSNGLKVCRLVFICTEIFNKISMSLDWNFCFETSFPKTDLIPVADRFQAGVGKYTHEKNTRRRRNSWPLASINHSPVIADIHSNNNHNRHELCFENVFNAPKFLVPIFAGKKTPMGKKTSRFAHLKIYFLVIIKNNYRSSFFSLVASGSADALIT